MFATAALGSTVFAATNDNSSAEESSKRYVFDVSVGLHSVSQQILDNGAPRKSMRESNVWTAAFTALMYEKLLCSCIQVPIKGICDCVKCSYVRRLQVLTAACASTVIAGDSSEGASPVNATQACVTVAREAVVFGMPVFVLERVCAANVTAT